MPKIFGRILKKQKIGVEGKSLRMDLIIEEDTDNQFCIQTRPKNFYKIIDLDTGIEWVNFSDELKEKFIEEDEFIYNKRLEIEREKTSNFHKKQAENGKKGGRPRKETTENQPNKDSENENPVVSVGLTQTKAKKSPSSSSSTSNVLLKKEPKEENISKEIPVDVSSENSGDTNPDSGKRKKIAPKKEKYFSKEDFKKKILDLGVEEEDADGWIKVRRQKRAVFTENAIKLVLEECKKHNIEFSEAIKASAKYGWQGFEYEWYLNKQKNNNGNNQSTSSGFANNRNGNDKVSGTAEIIDGARYTEFT